MINIRIVVDKGIEDSYRVPAICQAQELQQ